MVGAGEASARVEEGPAGGAVRPRRPQRASSSGAAPYRVLLVGSERAVTSGASAPERGLPGAVARGVTRRLGHGCDVVAYEGARRIRLAVNVEPFDAAVVVLAGDPLHAVDVGLVREAREVVSEIRRRLDPSCPVVVAIPLPATGADPTRPDLQQYQDAVGTSALVIGTADRTASDDPRDRDAALGEVLARALTPLLRAPGALASSEDVLDERARVVAMRASRAALDVQDPELARITGTAGATYATPFAGISLIDAHDAHYLVRRGFDAERAPRGSVACDLTLRTYGGFITGDARTDPRTAGMAAMREVGFYAGYRLENPDGFPVGTLCVFDPEARTVLSQDLSALRDLALAAQHRLWELADAPAPV